MILCENEKYACVTCIRGHRSSGCRHTNRMLVKIRTPGRPSAWDMRKVIMVDSKSRVQPSEVPKKEDSQGTCCSKNMEGNCGESEKQPILFLKARRRQNAVLVDGKLNIILGDHNGEEDETESEQVSLSEDLAKVKSIDEFKKLYKCVSEREFMLKYAKEKAASSPQDGNLCCGCKTKVEEIPTIVANPKKNFEKQSTPESDNSERNSNTANAPLPYFDFKINNFLEQVLHDNNGAGQDTKAPKVSANHLDPTFNANNDFFKSPGYTVDLLTHKGLFLSSSCSCPNDDCQCSNCLIHRNDNELDRYIQKSGVPLTQMGEAHLTNSNIRSIENDCNCSSQECQCELCPVHPVELIPFDRILLQGILNLPLRRKSIIIYKNKILPSNYWWDFLKLQIPLMSPQQQECLSLLSFFDNLLLIYAADLVDYHPESHGITTSRL